MVIVCECGNAECAEQISISLQEYEDLRSEPTQFALVPGHEDPSVEGVVTQHEGYSVVRKQDPEAEELAERTDPRG
jgi:hypothetical protein